MTTVYATMVGDLFHRGHLEFIKRASSKGGKLIIGVHPDWVVKSYKRTPVFCYRDRCEIIKSIWYVDKVVMDCMDLAEPSFLTNLKKYHVDIVVHGNDWLPDMYRECGCKVVQIPYYPHISTTKVIRLCKER